MRKEGRSLSLGAIALLAVLAFVPDKAAARNLVNTINSGCRGHLYQPGGVEGFEDYLSCTRDGLYEQWQYARGLIHGAEGVIAEYQRRRRLASTNCVDVEEFGRYRRAAEEDASRLQQQLRDVRTIANMVWTERQQDVSQAWIQGRLGRTLEYWASAVSRANKVDAERGLFDQAGKAAEELGSLRREIVYPIGTPCRGGPSSLPNLAGSWICREGCQGVLGRDEGIDFADIAQEGRRLRFKNEGGGTSEGHFVQGSDTQVVATDWGGLRATVSGDGRAIRWDNGTVWVRP